jgi:predicted ATPase/DNA-binding CsgD family transcriptional regulator
MLPNNFGVCYGTSSDVCYLLVRGQEAMARTTPTVHNSRLFYQRDGQDCQLVVGTPDWYAWLDTATSFAFRSTQGSFTARKERSGNKRGNWYWKAYTRRDGRLLHAYLGKTETLTVEHLRAVALELAQEQQYKDSGASVLNKRLPASEVHAHTTRLLGEHFKQDAQSILHAQSTAIIGREQETRTACTLLQRPDVRLLTITGPGGVGKTRLALHVADILTEDFADGVCYVSLASVTDAALVLPIIAQELGFVEAGETSLLPRLQAFLRDKHLLLLIDNFEQVVTAAPLLAELLSACPDLKMLVTSREVLHIHIEHELAVPPLALPATPDFSEPDEIRHYPAIALFIERARFVKPDFQVTDDDTHNLVEICRKLDGLPLAIELAASRIKLLPLHLLRARLDHRLQLLTGGSRDLPKRQQTLRDTLAWSYELLDAGEQQLFRLLSVFVRGCTLEVAEQFAQAFFQDTEQILPRIASLIDKSLLQRVEQSSGEARIIMLETMREYGQERLAECQEEATARGAHAMHYLALAEQAEGEMRKADQVTWFNRLDQENENIRVALSWLLEQDNIEAALRVCSALWIFWLVRDHRSEGLQWVERAIARSAHVQCTPMTRARANYAAGVLAESQGLHQRSVEYWNESLALYEQCDHSPGIAAVLNRLGHVYARSASSEAHDLYQKSLALAQQCHEPYATADALVSLADEALGLRDLATAHRLFEESLNIYTSLGDKRSIAYCLSGLGQVTASDGNHREAHALLEQSLALLREIKDRVGIAFGLIPLGMTTLYLGDYTTAYALLEESQTVSKKLGKQNEVARYLGVLGEAVLRQNREDAHGRALLEESLAIFRETGNEEEVASRLYTLGHIEFTQGNFGAAQKLLGECLAIFRRLGNQVMTATTLRLLGHLEAQKCNFAEAHTLMQESVALARQLGDQWMLSNSLSYLGLVTLNQGKYEEARAPLKESVALAREIGDQRRLADALGVMALLPLNEGEYAAAQELLEESLTIFKTREDRYAMVFRMADLGMLAIRQGKAENARPLIEEALALSIQLGNRWFTASCLERLGEVMVAQNQPLRAAELWGAAQAVRDAMGAPIPPIEFAPYKQALEQVKMLLDQPTFQATWNAGYTTPLEQVLADQSKLKRSPAQRRASRTSGHTPRARTTTPPALIESLTKREREVLRLLMNGASNREIARHLIISEGTVKKHVSNICGKFSVQRRSQVIAKALELSSH